MTASHPLVWQESLQIGWSNIDCCNRLRPGALLEFMQEAAGHDAARHGFGYPQIAPKGLAWMLVRLKLEMARWPAWKEAVFLETWSKGSESLYGLRDFRFLSGDGSVLGGATSAWLLINVQTRRPVRPDSVHGSPLPGLPEHEAIPGRPGKLAPVPEASVLVERQTAYGDIDYHQHVNNARYLEMALDALPLGFLRQHDLAALQVNFLAETLAGETLGIAKVHPPGRPMAMEIRNLDKGQLAAQLLLEWKPARPTN